MRNGIDLIVTSTFNLSLLLLTFTTNYQITRTASGEIRFWSKNQRLSNSDQVGPCLDFELEYVPASASLPPSILKTDPSPPLSGSATVRFPLDYRYRLAVQQPVILSSAREDIHSALSFTSVSVIVRSVLAHFGLRLTSASHTVEAVTFKNSKPGPDH